MTVQQLKEELNNLPDDMEVKFSYDYGDHWHTNVAERINNVGIDFVTYSDYHRMDKVVEENHKDGPREVVILS